MTCEGKRPNNCVYAHFQNASNRFARNWTDWFGRLYDRFRFSYSVNRFFPKKSHLQTETKQSVSNVSYSMTLTRWIRPRSVVRMTSAYARGRVCTNISRSVAKVRHTTEVSKNDICLRTRARRGHISHDFGVVRHNNVRRVLERIVRVQFDGIRTDHLILNFYRTAITHTRELFGT